MAEGTKFIALVTVTKKIVWRLNKQKLVAVYTVKNFRIQIFFRKVGRRSSVIIFPSIYGNMCNIVYVLTERFPLVNEIS